MPARRWLSRLKNRKLLLVFLLALVVIVYYPGLAGDFVFDDQTNLTDNYRLQIKDLSLASLQEATLSGNAGPTLRPVSSLTFALNYYFAKRFDPFHLKLVNLLIHLVNGVGIFVLTRLLLRAHGEHRTATGNATKRSDDLALMVTAAWLLHPLALTSVLYVIQRMNSLSALFTVWGLVLYLEGRLRMMEGKSGLHLMAGGIIGLGALATLAKENGALILPYALVIEIICLRFRTSMPASKPVLFFFIGAVIILPIVGAAAYFIYKWDWLLSAYGPRSFTLTERLMTESRILYIYLKWIIFPSNADLGLFHDDIPISADLLNPPTTIAAIIGLATTAIVAVALRKMTPFLAFGVLWYLLGHSMESSIIPLELAHEHRNYLPMYGILFAGFHALAPHGTNISLPRFRLAAALVLIILIGVVTSMRATLWGDNTTLFLMEVERHPYSSRAHYQAGIEYCKLLLDDKKNDDLHKKAYHHFNEALRLDPRVTNGLFGHIYLSQITERALEPQVLKELSYRLKINPATGFDVAALGDLVTNVERKYIKLKHNEMMMLFDAILENPLMAGGFPRASVFTLMSTYYANVVRSPAAAVALAMKAVETAPKEALFYVRYAQLMIPLRQFSIAKEQVAMAKANDTLGAFASEIREMEKELNLQ